MQVPFARSRAFKHPLATHTALDVLGYRRNGAPIYAIAGGNGEGEGASGSGGQSGSGESGTSGQGGQGEGSAAGGSGQGGQQSGQGAGQPGTATDSGTDWEAKYRETLAHSREWEKRAKANSGAADELEKLRQEKLTEQEKAVEAAEKAGRTAAEQEAATEIAKRDAQLRELTVKDAVRDRADKHGAKPAALLNSLSFRDRIKDLNPGDKTFGANLDDAIKAELKDHPEFAAQTAGQSGGDLSGGTGEGAARQRPTSLSAAVRGAFNT